MTNGEKLKEVFRISQVDEGESDAFVWLPNHDAVAISIEWWNAPYKAERSEKRNCNNCKYGYQSSVCQKPTAEICGNDFSQWMPCDAERSEKND